VPEPLTIDRRRQRRRAIIAWSSAAIVVALFAIGAILGGDEGDGGGDEPGLFGHLMTAKQYEDLHLGLSQAELLDRLEQVGLPEELTSGDDVRLFPPHSDEVVCSYWEISDRPGQIARTCFSDPAQRLVQKLRRGLFGEGFGVAA
jgi:hypothetical protein